MRNPIEFDAFYEDARDRLLLETYALTGDAAAARAAVRTSFASAWHHWRKVSRLEDREAWLRVLAWNRARHSARALRTRPDPATTEENTRTIAALRSLPLRQRKALLLAQLTPLTMPAIARELGVPQPEAEQELAAAGHSFVRERDTQAVFLPRHFHDLRADLRQEKRSEQWPSAAEIRAQGTRRRNLYTLAGVVLATVGVLGTGLIVADPEVASASLNDGRLTEHRAQRVAAPVGLPEVAEKSLLDDADISRIAPNLTWREVSTNPNLEGSGLVLPCQQARFSDPDGNATLVRSFEGSSPSKPNKPGKKGAKGSPQQTARQAQPAQAWEMTELSADAEAASAAFDTAVQWYAGCLQPRTTLLSTATLASVGDQARLFTYHDWRAANQRQVAVAVARSGDRLITTAAALPGTASAADGVRRALSAAVNRFCGQPGAGACAGPAAAQTIPVLAVGKFPGLLQELDLPMVPASKGPWVGAPPKPATTPVTTLTTCDRMDFSAKQVRRGVTRTYLFAENTKALEFGLNQSAGVTSPEKASSLVDGLVRQMSDCSDKNLAVTVRKLTDSSTKLEDEISWRVNVEISDSRSVTYFVGVVRNRGALSELTFVPSGEMKMSEDDFAQLLPRAAQRLRFLTSKP